MRSTAVVSFLVAAWALASRKGATFICEWGADFVWNQTRLLLSLLQFRLRLTWLEQSAAVTWVVAG